MAHSAKWISWRVITSAISPYSMNLSEILLPIHLTFLAFSAFHIVQADHMGYIWMTGKVDTLPKEKVAKHHRYLWMGLCLMIISGLCLFWPVREYLLTRPQFYFKMAFVATLVSNGFIIGSLQHFAVERKFASLSFSEKLPLILSGAVSTISWIGAGIMAFFLLP